MAKWSCQYVVVIAVVFIAMSDQSWAASLWTKTNPSLSTKPVSVEAMDDLTMLVKPVSNGHSEVFSHALELLSSMQSAPSCNRAATSNLLKDCKSIEGSSSSVQPALEDIRSTYAAQLAVCELRGSGSQIPPYCDISFASDASKSTHRLDRAGSAHLRHCLKSLESRPQWWTSYSNSRQNAVVLCQAARVEIEKDELVELYKSMAHTSSSIDEVLVETVNEAQRALVKQRNFAHAVENFQRQLIQDLKKSSSDAQSYFSRFTQNMERSIHSIFGRISTATRNVESEMAGFSQTLRQSNTDALDLNKNIAKVFQQVVQGSSELAASQTKQWDVSRELAVQVQTALQEMQGDQIATLIGAFGSIQNQLQTTNDLMSMMHSRQTALADQLTTLDQSFEKLETKAEAFQALQTRQSEMQVQLHDHMQKKMQMTSERLAAIDASASSISSNIRDLSSVLAQLSGLGGIIGAVVRWKWQVLTVLAIAWFSRRGAAYATAVMVSFHVVEVLWDLIPSEMILVHYASGYELSLATIIRLAGVLLSIPFIITLVRALQRQATSTKVQDWQTHPLTAVAKLQARFRQFDGLILHSEH
ncbi:hypothetical protein MMC30_000755 [Trapelia coarctata]|nr:hypothetical protein [Trapelia coarctata]